MKKQYKRPTGRRYRLIALFLAMTLMIFSGCGGETAEEIKEGPPEIAGLTFESETELQRAAGFSIYNYENDYTYIDIHDYQKLLLIPEGAETPEGLSEDVIVLEKPVDRIYLAATATMALFCSIDALDNIRMSSIREEDWTFDEPAKAMEKGDILYAGKYSSPDFEVMLDEGCRLAIESTMIDHTPEIKETLDEVGIPVMIDRSSYEEDPMGRTEWIKLYGALTGKEKEAEEFFSRQMDSIRHLEDFENTEKTVAFFYITSDGKVVARSSTDYVPKMIEIAGARYVFKDLDDESGRSSVDMSVETFYDTAADADYVIYNGSIDGSVTDLESLKDKDPIIARMKAVKEGNCWVTGSSMYQRTDLVAGIIADFHRVFSEDDPKDLKYLQKLK